jgi:hypothetical protein
VRRRANSGLPSYAAGRPPAALCDRPVNLIDPSGLTPERAAAADLGNPLTRALSEGVQQL